MSTLEEDAAFAMAVVKNEANRDMFLTGPTWTVEQGARRFIEVMKERGWGFQRLRPARIPPINFGEQWAAKGGKMPWEPKGCAGDGMGEPSTCQIHMAPWYRAESACRGSEKFSEPRSARLTDEG